MTLAARFSLLHSDLNDFLFASVGDEQNGMPLSVLSALTRLGVDPWEEAATACGFAKGACHRGNGVDRRPVADGSTAAFRQSGHQPPTGRAVAKAPASRAANSRTDRRKGQEILSCPDAYRLSCPRGGAVDRHLVIRHRHDRSKTKIRPLVFKKGKVMKYLVPPVVIPMLLFIGIVAYALLRPPIVVGHSLAPVSIAQPR